MSATLKALNPSALWTVPEAFRTVYSHATEVSSASKMLFISGQFGVRPDGSLPEAFANQAEQAIDNIEAVLSESASAASQPELLYSAAQIYALAGKREGMLDYAQRSMKAGYPREEFRRAPEFAAFADDPEFNRLMVASFDGS